MAATCIHHPVKPAVSKCRQCLAPLCIQCRRSMPDGGIYCSDECWKAFREFQGLVDPKGGSRSRGRISILGSLRTMVISAILIAFIYGVLVFWLKTTDPSQMLVELGKIWRQLTH